MGQNYSVDEQTWKQIQRFEALSWGEQAYPNVEGKINREVNNQRDLVRELGFDVYIATIPTDKPIYLLDLGAGPRSVLEDYAGSLPRNVVPCAADPLADEYDNLGEYGMDTYRTDYFTCPAEDLSFVPSEIPYFDAIICSNSLDHFRDPEVACQEMKRVLRHDGLLFLQFCLDNATYNPHPAHLIDLNPIVVQKWLDMQVIRWKWSEYSWRKQPSVNMVFKKS